MLVLNEGTPNEVALRVVLESDEYGREYFDHYENMEEIIKAVGRLVETCADEFTHDGVERVVGVAIVPKTNFGGGCEG